MTNAIGNNRKRVVTGFVKAPRHLHDLDALRHLKDQFEKIGELPGLYHVTRIRFDGVACGARGLTTGWRQFVGPERVFEHAVLETRAGPGFQQACFFGGRSKLAAYTQCAADALRLVPMDFVPIVHHHRNARADRDQWTLGLYSAAHRLEWAIAIDSLGNGPYRSLDIDPVDALGAADGKRTASAVGNLVRDTRDGIASKGQAVPKYLYAALAVDVCAASARVLRGHIEDIEAGVYDTAPAALLPGNAKRKPPAASPASSAWPPDDGWHFRPGEFAFAGLRGSIKGQSNQLLQVMALGLPKTSTDLQREVWDKRSISESCIRSLLTTVRGILRHTFGLTVSDDPLPSVAKLAWKLDDEMLRKAANRISSADQARR